MKKWMIRLGILVLVLAGVTALTMKMLHLGEVECRLCVEFNGVRQCPTAYGPTEDAAREEALRTACSLIASGVTETLACQRAPVTEVICRSTY